MSWHFTEYEFSSEIYSWARQAQIEMPGYVCLRILQPKATKTLRTRIAG